MLRGMLVDLFVKGQHMHGRPQDRSGFPRLSKLAWHRGTILCHYMTLSFYFYFRICRVDGSSEDGLTGSGLVALIPSVPRPFRFGVSRSSRGKHEFGCVACVTDLKGMQNMSLWNALEPAL